MTSKKEVALSFLPAGGRPLLGQDCSLVTGAKRRVMKERIVCVRISSICLKTGANRAEQTQVALRRCSTTMPQCRGSSPAGSCRLSRQSRWAKWIITATGKMVNLSRGAHWTFKGLSSLLLFFWGREHHRDRLARPAMLTNAGCGVGVETSRSMTYHVA